MVIFSLSNYLAVTDSVKTAIAAIEVLNKSSSKKVCIQKMEFLKEFDDGNHILGGCDV